MTGTNVAPCGKVSCSIISKCDSDGSDGVEGSKNKELFASRTCDMRRFPYLSLPPPIRGMHLGVQPLSVSVVFPSRFVCDIVPVCRLRKEVFDTTHNVSIEKDGGAIIMFKGPLIPREEILIWVEGLYILIKLVRRSKAGRRRCRKPGGEIFIDS